MKETGLVLRVLRKPGDVMMLVVFLVFWAVASLLWLSEFLLEFYEFCKELNGLVFVI